MPPFQVLDAQSDGDGGVMIHWYDPSNIDGQPLEGYFHLTDDSVKELIVGQRRPNNAPEDKLTDVLLLLADKPAAPQAIQAVAQAWARAYDEVVQDRIDRHNLGLKAVTKDGHADLEAVRGGAAVKPENAARPPGREAFDQFITNRGAAT